MIKNFGKNIILNIKVIYKISIYNLWKNRSNQSVKGIVFSKDRPMQLYSLLESYFRHCYDPKELVVLYNASTKSYDDSYDELFNYFKHKNINFIKENNYREDLLNILSKLSSTYVFFLVDDIIFKSSFSFNDFLILPHKDKYILSLRLGNNLNFCYTLQKPQPLPKFRTIENFISWDWKQGKYDWNYVFSIDGNLYNKFYIHEMAKLVPFKAPNSFESNMNMFRYIFRKKRGLCFNSSILINVCINRVQDEIENISGKISALQLLNYWQSSLKINIDCFENIINKSAHIEVDSLSFKIRNSNA